MNKNYFNSKTSCRRRHTLPSASFVDPTIIRYIERASSTSSIQHMLEDEEEEYDMDDMDDQQSTITSVSLPQQLHYHKPVTNTNNLDQLWAKQDRYDNLELRLMSLEVTKKRFESRLQALEDGVHKPIILQQQQQPMKPDQQQPTSTTTTTTSTTRRILQGNMIHHDNRLTETHDHGDDNNKINKEEMMVTKQKYLDLLDKHESLMNKYNSIQIEFEEKERYYKQKIEDLLLNSNNKVTSTSNHNNNNINQKQQQQQQHDEEPSYIEEDGYLIFDTTNMNGEIIHCKVKIPTPTMALASPPATRVSSPQYQSTLTPLPSNINNINHNIPKKKKGLNYNAPEWKATTTFNTNRT